ncbi:MAG: hypothetical protein OWU84_04670 [Firmicutes bacterium]|nr:hypothetical protein [Bacillota bacterium]
MKRAATRTAAGIAAMVLAVAVSGLALADGHHTRGHMLGDNHEIIRGTYESSATGMPMIPGSIAVKTANGQTVSIEVTASTRISFEAEGNAGSLGSALSSGHVWITANVVNQQNQWVALSVNAHLNAAAPENEEPAKDPHQHAHHQDPTHHRGRES